MTRRTTRILSVVLPAAIAWGCSGAPDHLPGGAKASKAARATGEQLGNAMMKGVNRGEEDKVRGTLDAAQRALEQYSVDASAYPVAGSCAELMSGLGRSGRFLGLNGNDPWGNPFECRSTESGYSIRSLGPDGEAMTDDDLHVEGGSAP